MRRDWAPSRMRKAHQLNLCDRPNSGEGSVLSSTQRACGVADDVLRFLTLLASPAMPVLLGHTRLLSNFKMSRAVAKLFFILQNRGSSFLKCPSPQPSEPLSSSSRVLPPTRDPQILTLKRASPSHLEAGGWLPSSPRRPMQPDYYWYVHCKIHSYVQLTCHL